MSQDTNASASGELAPCPFCGENDVAVHQHPVGGTAHMVLCHNCTAEGPLTQSEMAAATCWNGRASAPVAAAPAAIKTWQERYAELSAYLNMPLKEDRAENNRIACRDAEIADLRAALQQRPAPAQAGDQVTDGIFTSTLSANGATVHNALSAAGHPVQRLVSRAQQAEAAPAPTSDPITEHSRSLGALGLALGRRDAAQATPAPTAEPVAHVRDGLEGVWAEMVEEFVNDFPEGTPLYAAPVAQAEAAAPAAESTDDLWLSDLERKSLNRILSAAGVCALEELSNSSAMAAFWSLAGTIANMLESRAAPAVALPAAPTDLDAVNDMRIALTIQIDELIDVCERYERAVNAQGDDEEQRYVQGAIDYARKVASPYKYNGPYRAKGASK